MKEPLQENSVLPPSGHTLSQYEKDSTLERGSGKKLGKSMVFLDGLASLRPTLESPSVS